MKAFMPDIGRDFTWVVFTGMPARAAHWSAYSPY
jgi:hypothetical protein